MCIELIVVLVFVFFGGVSLLVLVVGVELFLVIVFCLIVVLFLCIVF